MQLDFQKIINYLLLILALIGGIVAGRLAIQSLSLSYGVDLEVQGRQGLRQAVVRKLTEEDFQVILSRNLFDSQAAGKVTEQIVLSDKPLAEQNADNIKPSGDLSLIGTVVAGEDSLALIQVGREVDLFHLNETIVPGVELLEVTRQLVIVRERGVRRELLLQENKPSPTRRVNPKTTGASGISEVGGNRWQVSKAVAENARANLNDLLKTARMVPELKDGETIGFKLEYLQRGSLLQKIGLKVGDLLVEINGVELKSPEKALQIFQQVREAENINIGLIRNGKRESFQYDLQ